MDNDPILPYGYIITGPDVFCMRHGVWRSHLGAGAYAKSLVQFEALEGSHEIMSADHWRAPLLLAHRGPLEGATPRATTPPAHGRAQASPALALILFLLLKFLKTFTYCSLLIEYNLPIFPFTTTKKSFSGTKNCGYCIFSQKFLRENLKTFSYLYFKRR